MSCGSTPCAAEYVVARPARTAQLVGRNGGAYATAADNEPALDASVDDGTPHRGREVWVIHWRGRVGAEVGDLVSLLAQPLREVLLHLEACVVGANSDAHRVGEDSMSARRDAAGCATLAA